MLSSRTRGSCLTGTWVDTVHWFFPSNSLSTSFRLFFFLSLSVFSPFSALIALLVAALVSLPALAILRSLLRRYRETDIGALQGTGSWIFGAAAFLGFQFVLLVGLVKLGLKGPQLNWQQVPGTRIPVSVSAST